MSEFGARIEKYHHLSDVVISKDRQIEVDTEWLDEIMEKRELF